MAGPEGCCQVGEEEGGRAGQLQDEGPAWERACCPVPPTLHLQAKLRDLRKAAAEAGVQGLALPLAAVSTGVLITGGMLAPIGVPCWR